MNKLENMSLPEMQAVHEIRMSRARLAVAAWRNDGRGRPDYVLTSEELRAVLLPALGLGEESSE